MQPANDAQLDILRRRWRRQNLSRCRRRIFPGPIGIQLQVVRIAALLRRRLMLSISPLNLRDIARIGAAPDDRRYQLLIDAELLTQKTLRFLLRKTTHRMKLEKRSRIELRRTRTTPVFTRTGQWPASREDDAQRRESARSRSRLISQRLAPVRQGAEDTKKSRELFDRAGGP